jgi:SOS-response transcriptional repressor LexA
MTMPLTARQEQLWRYIKSCERSPSFTEMQKALGLDSKSGVHRLVTALEQKGFILRTPNVVRSIVAIEPEYMWRARQAAPDSALRKPSAYPEIVYLPLHGRIS